VTGPDGLRCAPRIVKGDINDPDSFRAHLVGIVKAEAPDLAGRPEASWIGDYELHVSRSALTDVVTILRLS
jgi:hypothetical protein